MKLKKKVVEQGDSRFKEHLIQFLDDTIHTAIPVELFDSNMGSYDPCTVKAPPSGRSEQEDLCRLARRCQLHTHTHTCYKYSQTECRFGLGDDKCTERTTIDDETGELCMRCLNSLVNNFNETMLKAIRCNMDIKFIGSGASAKAVLYYITDYITKTDLKTHVAFAALELAVLKLNDIQANEDDATYRARRLLQCCAYALIAHQELSAQQVASYLLNYDDHFTSHRFTNLYWLTFENLVERFTPSTNCEAECNESSEVDDTTRLNERSATVSAEVSVHEDTGELVMLSDSAADYLCRGEELKDLSLWDFVSRTEKVSMESDKRKQRRTDDEPSDSEGTDEDDSYDNEPAFDAEEPLLWDCHFHSNKLLMSKKRVRPRVRFDDLHHQAKTHLIKVRSHAQRRVPVPIGPSIPRRDKPESVNRHA